MKCLALTVAFLALPASAWAQVLTLNCRYQSVYDGIKAGSKTSKSGGFSAIVHMNECPAWPGSKSLPRAASTMSAVLTSRKLLEIVRFTSGDESQILTHN
jgi:hypothetical protein